MSNRRFPTGMRPRRGLGDLDEFKLAEREELFERLPGIPTPGSKLPPPVTPGFGNQPVGLDAPGIPNKVDSVFPTRPVNAFDFQSEILSVYTCRGNIVGGLFYPAADPGGCINFRRPDNAALFSLDNLNSPKIATFSFAQDEYVTIIQSFTVGVLYRIIRNGTLSDGITQLIPLPGLNAANSGYYIEPFQNSFYINNVQIWQTDFGVADSIKMYALCQPLGQVSAKLIASSSGFDFITLVPCLGLADSTEADQTVLEMHFFSIIDGTKLFSRGLPVQFEVT